MVLLLKIIWCEMFHAGHHGIVSFRIPTTKTNEHFHGFKKYLNEWGCFKCGRKWAHTEWSKTN